MINWKVQSDDKGLSDGQKVSSHGPDSQGRQYCDEVTWYPARLVTAQSIRVDRPRVTVWMLPLVLTNQSRVLASRTNQRPGLPGVEEAGPGRGRGHRDGRRLCLGRGAAELQPEVPLEARVVNIACRGHTLSQGGPGPQAAVQWYSLDDQVHILYRWLYYGQIAH